MKLGAYEAIELKEIRTLFLNYIAALDIPIIDYIAIGIQDTIHKTSTSLMSRAEWQNTFKKLNLAQHDPVRKASFNTSSKVFCFDELDYQDSYGKEVMRQRRIHDIKNGIIVIHRNLGHNFMFTLGTGYENFKAYKFYIDHINSLDRMFADLRQIIMPSTKKYHAFMNNCLSDDAK